jgi:hypothetical protein
MKRKLYIFLVLGFVLSSSSVNAQRFTVGALSELFVGASIFNTKSNIEIPKNSYKAFYIRDQSQVHIVPSTSVGFKFALDYGRFIASLGLTFGLRMSTMEFAIPLGDGSLSSYSGGVMEMGPYIPLSVEYVFANTRRARFSVSGGVSYLYAWTVGMDMLMRYGIVAGGHGIMEDILWTENPHLLSTTVGLQVGWNWFGWYQQMGPKYERRMVGIGEGNTHLGFIMLSWQLSLPFSKNIKGYRVYINEE